jgi:predicted RNase H-like HicB family nuclease
VLSKHLHYPGKWVGAAYPLFDIHELKATTLEEAKAEVAQAALKWIETAQKYLNL